VTTRLAEPMEFTPQLAGNKPDEQSTDERAVVGPENYAADRLSRCAADLFGTVTSAVPGGLAESDNDDNDNDDADNEPSDGRRTASSPADEEPCEEQLQLQDMLRLPTIVEKVLHHETEQLRDLHDECWSLLMVGLVDSHPSPVHGAFSPECATSATLRLIAGRLESAGLSLHEALNAKWSGKGRHKVSNSSWWENAAPLAWT